MSTDTFSEDNISACCEDDNTTNTFIYGLYHASKYTVLCTSYSIGPLAIFSVLRQHCANSFKILLIIISGIFFRFFNFIETSRIERSIATSDKESKLCVDFNPPVVLLTGVICLMIVLGVIEKSCSNKKVCRLYQHLSLLYVCTTCTGIAYLYSTSGIELQQFPIFATKDDLFYLSICLSDPAENPLPMVLEYGLLLIPLSVIFMVYFHHRYNGKRPISVVTSCQIDPPVCSVCDCINNSFIEILCLYGIGYLVIRPGMLGYCFLYQVNMRDVVPPVFNILVHFATSFRCIMMFKCKRKDNQKSPALGVNRKSYEERMILQV